MEIILNGKKVSANVGETILDVAKRNGVNIPTLCFLKEVGATSNCRMCLVEVKGQRNLVTACSFKVYEGMEVITNSANIYSARKTNLELILSNHNYNCSECSKSGKCALEKLAQEYMVDENRFEGGKTEASLDETSSAIVRDNSKCILCKKCVQVCESIQAVNAIKPINRGFNTKIGCAFGANLNESTCVGCGQCIMACPTGALSENFKLNEVEELLNDSSKIKVVAPAPAVRVAIMEALQMDINEEGERILPSILRAVGFDKVFDINFAADLTIMEEGAEFIERLKTGENLPMFTSCCPGWVEYQKKFYPEMAKNVSSCKSPMLMFGAVAKTYFADKMNISKEDIKVVSIMPCVAKKKERELKGQFGTPDIDISLTVRELVELVKRKEINVSQLTPSGFDSLMGESSGAGVIFGATGGVMEAAVRTVNDLLSGKDNLNIDYLPIRGLEGTKMATLNIAGKEVNIAVVSGLKNANNLIEKIKSGELNLHFVEVMACPGGCVNGGGMPFVENREEAVKNRVEKLYNLDKARKKRKSHQNPEIIEFYNWQNEKKKNGEQHAHLHIH